MRFEHFVKVFALECNDVSKRRSNSSISKMNIFTKIAKDFFLIFSYYKEHNSVPLKDVTNLEVSLSYYLDCIKISKQSKPSFIKV